MRQPVFAGHFYPETSQACQLYLKTLFQNVSDTPLSDSILGLISPHAGYQYSGDVAALGMATLKKAYATVVVISPSHHFHFPGVSVYSGQGYRTPLGDIYIDKTLTQHIRTAHHSFGFNPIIHQKEHGVEVQLPFLQYVLGNSFKLVSIVMGNQSEETIQNLTQALTETYSSETLYIASSDFSHFFSADTAIRMDQRAIDLIQNQDYAELYQEQHHKTVQMCGLGAIISIGELLKSKKVNVRALRYKHSGEVTGDMNSVVGYSAMVITQ